MRAVAAQFGVSLCTVQRWVAHAGDQRLDRVDWSGARGGRREAQVLVVEYGEDGLGSGVHGNQVACHEVSMARNQIRLVQSEAESVERA